MIYDQYLTYVRLSARHSGDPLDAEYLDYLMESYGLRESDARAAYQEGLDARNSGMQCLCGNCGGEDIRKKERLRIQYLLKRQDELERQGLSATEIRRITEEEIARGAALKGQYHDEGKM